MRPPLKVRDADPPTAQIHTRSSGPGHVTGVLIGLEGTLADEVLRLRNGVNLIGSARTCSLKVPTQGDPRAVARVVCGVTEPFLIEPLGPSGEVRMGDDGITGAADLRDGATVWIAGTRFRFRTVD